MPDPWFHVPDLPAVGETCELSAGETRHAAGARRLAAGDGITLFDGRGAVAAALVESVDRSPTRVVARVVGIRVEPPLRPQVHLAFAVPKGDRASTLIAMATQLGAASLRPMACARSVARPGRGFTARGDRLIVEACKQSRRAHRPALLEVVPLERVCDEAAAAGMAMWMAHPGAMPLAETLRGGVPEHLLLLVGPEGGFAEDEVTRARAAGTTLAALGPTILRTETAAVAFLAAALLRVRVAEDCDADS
jgi:16S rRNA (uracil1498-N3)-methyltransferase